MPGPRPHRRRARKDPSAREVHRRPWHAASRSGRRHERDREYPSDGPTSTWAATMPTCISWPTRPPCASCRGRPTCTQLIHDCYDQPRSVRARAVLRRVRTVRPQGLDPGGRAGTGVLPGRAQYRSRPAPARRSGAAAAPKPRARPIRSTRSTNSIRCSRTCTTTAKMELNVDTLIHEVGAGQMEINFFHPRRWPSPTTSSCSSARCARRRCGTTCTPRSWPSR